MDVWELMSQECRDEVVLIDSSCLLETLETYLRKHRYGKRANHTFLLRNTWFYPSVQNVEGFFACETEDLSLVVMEDLARLHGVG